MSLNITDKYASSKALANTNWFDWKLNMIGVFRSKKLYTSVVLNKKGDSSDFDFDFMQKNEEALGLLSLHLPSKLNRKIVDETLCSSAWEKLLDYMEKKEACSLQVLQADYHSMKMNDSQSARDYVNELDDLRGRLKSSGYDISDSMHKTRLLGSLTGFYSQVVSVLYSDKNIDLDGIVQRLEDEETLFNRKPKQVESSMLQKSQKFNGKCFKCGKVGHYKRD